MKNPFTLAFGKKPSQFISRLSQTDELIEDLIDEDPASQAYMITGVRGSGKTVMMTTIRAQMEKEDNWYTIELNPERDMLHSLAAKLYQIPEMKSLFIKTKLDLSLLGISASLENSVPVLDIETAIERMLDQVKKAGKRVLILIDEVVGNEFVRPFATQFQILIRQDYPVFLLMTGLYENLYELQNDKALTFLYRTPKIYLEPLNFTAMRQIYKKVFDTDTEHADRMVLMTMGYPYAFQVLGYVTWAAGKQADKDDIEAEFDHYMSKYVYEKIWSELSAKDREILICMATNGYTAIKQIREIMDMSSNSFSVYRDRLKRKGIIDTSRYGNISFTLPRFDVFVRTQEKLGQ